MPTAKDYDAEGGEDDEELDAHEARRYRRMAATINYFASDRPDLQFTASMLGRTMPRATTRSWFNLKKVARHLRKHRQVRDDRGNHRVSSLHRLHRHLSAQEDVKNTVVEVRTQRLNVSLARYLKEHPQVKYEYHDVTMDEVKELVGSSDSD